MKETNIATSMLLNEKDTSNQDRGE